jgi:hypothetical protein
MRTLDIVFSFARSHSRASMDESLSAVERPLGLEPAKYLQRSVK